MLDLADADAVEPLVGALRREIAYHLATNVFSSRDLAINLPTFPSNLASTAHPRYPAAMSTLVIELEDNLIRHLETIGSREPRPRSEVISRVTRNALSEIEKRKTAAAYARQPDTGEETYFDPEVWEHYTRR